MTQKLRTKEADDTDRDRRSYAVQMADCVTYPEFDWTAASRLNRLGVAGAINHLPLGQVE